MAPKACSPARTCMQGGGEEVSIEKKIYKFTTTTKLPVLRGTTCLSNVQQDGLYGEYTQCRVEGAEQPTTMIRFEETKSIGGFPIQTPSQI